MKKTEHTLSVIIKGRTWGGFNSEYKYPLNPNQLDSFNQLSDFKKIAGDFETITSATLYKSIIITDYEIKKFN